MYSYYKSCLGEFKISHAAQTIFPHVPICFFKCVMLIIKFTIIAWRDNGLRLKLYILAKGCPHE